MSRVLQTIALPLGYVAVFSFLCWLGASEQGVADLCLTTWLRRHIILNDPKGIRTPVTAVKGRCLNRLTMGSRPDTALQLPGSGENVEHLGRGGELDLCGGPGRF